MKMIVYFWGEPRSDDCWTGSVWYYGYYHHHCLSDSMLYWIHPHSKLIM